MVGQHEGKLGIHGQEQENDQRVRECDEESRPRIVPDGAFLLAGLVHLPRGVTLVGIESETEQHDTSHNLEIEAVLVVVDQIHHERHTKAGNSRIDDVTHRSTDTRSQSVPASLVQRALHTKDTDRSHRRGCDHTDQQPLEDEIQYVYWYVKRHNGCKITNKKRYYTLFLQNNPKNASDNLQPKHRQIVVRGSTVAEVIYGGFQCLNGLTGILKLPAPDGAVHYVRYPLVYLVEAADDICYQIMDIEDAHKLKILTTEETRRLFLAYFPTEQQQHIEKRMAQLVDDVNEQIVYLRSCVINCLEQQCVRVFIENEQAILSGTFQGSLIKHIDDLPRSAYEQCEKIAFQKIYHCKDVVDIELAGYKVITTLTDLMVQAVTHSERAFSQLLINRVSTQYDILAPTLYERIMAVLDYISGMTDVFALDLYRKINGMSLPDV